MIYHKSPIYNEQITVMKDDIVHFREICAVRVGNKMKAKEDLRIIKTKKNIEYSFLKLLKTIPFQKMTIKQILEEALINRGTFYHHYIDKYDLAEQVAMAELDRGEGRLLRCLAYAEKLPLSSWWEHMEPFSPDEIEMWFLLADIPLNGGTFETEYKKMVYNHFYRYISKYINQQKYDTHIQNHDTNKQDHNTNKQDYNIKKQGHEEAQISLMTLAAVQLYTGYFPFYKQSSDDPSFEEYIRAANAVL